MNAPTARERLVVALDLPDLDEAVRLAGRLAGHVGWFKVGLELFGAWGPEAVHRIGEHGSVFLDLKLHDIPTTVERAAARLSALGAGLLTVHAGGGPAMLRAAVQGFASGRVLAVSVLTSLSDEELVLLGEERAAERVVRLARVAVEAGVPGLVCAPPDLVRVRTAIGPDPLVVTPGVRPAGSTPDDHARVATPGGALEEGADLLVVGRPIVRADDPVAAADGVVAQIAAAEPA
ncbi:MAG: hypothetical protein RLZZ272_445 [Actinomycetota bacterium]